MYYWDAIKGLDFQKRVSLAELRTDPDTSEMYVSSPRFIVKKILFDYQIGPQDGFFDYGCGKGLVLAIAHKFKPRYLGGVEISRRLVEIAHHNFGILGIDNGVEIICDDARNVKNIDNYNYFYFFNPFPRPVFSAVMSNIIDSYHNRKRKMVIIYDNPVCKEDVLASGIFELSRTIKKKWYNLLWCDICIFESKP